MVVDLGCGCGGGFPELLLKAAASVSLMARLPLTGTTTSLVAVPNTVPLHISDSVYLN